MKMALDSRALRTLLVATLTSSVLSALVITATPAGAAPVTTDVATASQQAEETGTAVPIPSLTDAYSTTQALPDGNLESTISPQPVRVEQGDRWVPLDATLVANDDGTFSPQASTNQLVISGGGDDALASMSAGDSQLALSWPTPLDTPTIDGASATYSNVLPDVDLRVTADTQGGISELLIVKTPEAADNPALETLPIATDTTSTRLDSDAAGNITGTDPDGQTVFTAPAPIMWDSGSASDSTPQQDGAPAGSIPADDATTAPVDVDVTDDQVTLTPDQELLSDPDTTFPVYIDPAFLPGTGTGGGWAWAQQAFPTTSWWNTNTNGYPAVGYQGWQAGSQGRNNSYFQFDTSAISGAHINQATLGLWETDTGSWDCDLHRDLEVAKSNQIGPNTTWNNQPALTGTFSKTMTVTGAAAQGGCQQHLEQVRVDDAVATDGNGIITLRVKPVHSDAANNEDDKTFYRRFASNGDHAASLSVTFNWLPDAPTGLSMDPATRNPDGGNCGNNVQNYGWIGALPPHYNVTLGATVTDRDNDPSNRYYNQQSVWASFHLWDKGTDGGAAVDNPIQVDTSAGKTNESTDYPAHVNMNFDADILKNGHAYGFNAIARDGVGDNHSSGTSNPCFFWYDSSAPTVDTPTSDDFTNDGTGTGSVGSEGTITLHAYDDGTGTQSGIGHFNYSLSSASDVTEEPGCDPDQCVVADQAGPGATGNLPLTPTVWGTHVLYVEAVDKAGNSSGVLAYPFFVKDGPFNPAEGDVDGPAGTNHRPDLLAIKNDNLYLYNTTTSSSHLPAPVVASTAADGIGGHWNGALIAHRGSATGTAIDDLWALKNGQLWLYTNNANDPSYQIGQPFFTTGGGHSVLVYAPACSSCSGYTQDWNDVTQLDAPGDIIGDHHADLLMVKNGTLWLFPGLPGDQLGAPTDLGSGWANQDVITPGDATGDGTPDILARNPTTGALLMYRVLRKHTDVDLNNTVLADAVKAASTSWSSGTRRLVVSPGDVGINNRPEVFSISTGSPAELDSNELTELSETDLSLDAHTVLDDGAGPTDWSPITAIA